MCDLQGRAVIPGFVQTHVHLCQVLFRGRADDLALLDWLRTRIWPYEAAHDEESTYLSALLGCMELRAGGVTSVCVMESSAMPPLRPRPWRKPAFGVSLGRP